MSSGAGQLVLGMDQCLVPLVGISENVDLHLY